MRDPAIVLERHDNVLEVRLDRPQRRNALSRSTLLFLRDTLIALPSDVAAITLTAVGSVFSAGADFAELTGTPADLEYDRDLDAACDAVLRSTVPVVAAVHGPCVGAGVELALSCDARVVGPSSCFRVPAVELGLLYKPASIRRLHAALPRGTVTRLMAFSESFDSDSAFTAGIATHTTEYDVRSQALAVAQSLAMLPCDALNATRRLLIELDEGTYAAAEWQRTRHELLSSTARRDLVAAARRRHR